VIKRSIWEQIGMAKNRTPDFGKRGCEQGGPAVARVTVVQRIKALGARYLQAAGLQTKFHASKSAFKASRPRP
jgi:hypothetical protein